MNLFQTELGLLQTVLLFLAIGIIIWGGLYASSLLVGIVWVISVSILAILIYVISKRFIRRLVHGGGGRK
jgi:membrane protein implicated in regulation of membrane protease activity